jgi:hypothetical protein
MKCCICNKAYKGKHRETPQGYKSTLKRIGIEGEKVHPSCLSVAIRKFESDKYQEKDYEI